MILFISLSALLASALANDISHSFSSSGILSDVLSSLNPEMGKLSVKYSGGLKAKYGNELTPTEVKRQPKLKWKADEEQLYTVIMTDPDAPSRANPVRREFKHWIVVNIPGNQVDEGDTVAGYIGSGPPKDSGLHRYVFLVYKQKERVTVDDTVSSTSTKGRASFRAQKFAEQYEMEGPIAGNFFQAQYDDWVPQLYKTFTD